MATTTEEKTTEKPKKISLPEHLEAVVTGLEEQTEPFSDEDMAAIQALQKRLSRTMGYYREPKEK